MIQWGARNGVADARKVLQSERDAGAKIFVPAGQLLRSLDLLTALQFVHLTRAPAEFRLKF
jgi:hypothetical protein